MYYRVLKFEHNLSAWATKAVSKGREWRGHWKLCALTIIYNNNQTSSLTFTIPVDQRIIILWRFRTMDMPQSGAADQPSNKSSQVCPFLPYPSPIPGMTVLSPLQPTTSDSVVSKVCIVYQSNCFGVVSNRHGPAIPQAMSFLRNIINETAVAFKRLLEQGKIYNSLTWTSLMTILLDAEFQGSTIPKIIDLLSHKELDVRKAAADALLKLSERGNISIFLIWTSLMYYS